MTVREIKEILSAFLITGGEHLDTDVHSACGSDKMNGNFPYRKSIRLKEYDYTSNSAYYITICTKNRVRLFGDIVGTPSNPAQMVLNDSGAAVKET